MQSPFRRQSGERPFVLGHRGARHAAPENTLKAFDMAAAEGADGVELDVRLCQSGEVIVLHDPTLLMRRAWKLGSNITFYDACYVALAELLDAVLLTTDARVQRAPISKARIQVLAPE